MLLLLLVPGVALAQSAPATEAGATSGAAPAPPAAPPPPAAPSAGGEAARPTVHFATAEPGVTVYSRPVPAERLKGAEVGEPPEFSAVCQAPCDAALDPKVHEFALAPAGRAPIPAAPAFEIKADAQFQGAIISHASERRTGFWIFGIMAAVGVTSTTIGMFQTCVDDQTCQEWTSLAIWGGIAVTTAGALIGIPKIATSDEATMTLVPGAAPLPNLPNPAGARRLSGAEHASAVPAGATLIGRF